MGPSPRLRPRHNTKIKSMSVLAAIASQAAGLARVQEDAQHKRRALSELQQRAAALADEKQSLCQQKRRLGQRKRARRRVASDREIAGRLTGQTVFAVAPGRVGVRLDTSHAGRYYEAYHVMIQDEGGRARVGQHTLPAFLPVEALADELLGGSDGKSTKGFLDALSGLLDAFVARREMLRGDSRLHGVQASLAVDFVSFETDDLDVKMIFDDLVSAIPSRALVRNKHDRERRVDLEMRLTMMPLPEALWGSN